MRFIVMQEKTSLKTAWKDLNITLQRLPTTKKTSYVLFLKILKVDMTL